MVASILAEVEGDRGIVELSMNIILTIGWILTGAVVVGAVFLVVDAVLVRRHRGRS